MARMTAPATASSAASAASPDRAAHAHTPAVELRGVASGYDARVALDGVDLTLPVGSLAAIVGPNGGGKSTLLKLLLGLIEPWDGSVRVFGLAPAPPAGGSATCPRPAPATGASRPPSARSS